MASVVREIIIDAPPERVWSAVGDFENGPVRTSPGVIVECRLEEPDVRAMTFADGTVARERLISRDEQSRRIVWAWFGDEVAHDNTSMQVFPEGETRTRLVWIHDTLPDALSDQLATAMDQSASAFQQALSSSPEPERGRT
jgi:hypothetical protein